MSNKYPITYDKREGNSKRKMGKKLEGEKGKKIEREKEWVNVSKLELGFYFSIPSLTFQDSCKNKRPSRQKKVCCIHT